MAVQQNDNSSRSSGGEADLAQAFKDLARGEQTASALENHLTALESKIDELLAKAAEDQSPVQDTKKNRSTTSEKPSNRGGSST